MNERENSIHRKISMVLNDLNAAKAELEEKDGNLARCLNKCIEHVEAIKREASFGYDLLSESHELF